MELDDAAYHQAWASVRKALEEAGESSLIPFCSAVLEDLSTNDYGQRLLAESLHSVFVVIGGALEAGGYVTMANAGAAITEQQHRKVKEVVDGLSDAPELAAPFMVHVGLLPDANMREGMISILTRARIAGGW